MTTPPAQPEPALVMGVFNDAEHAEAAIAALRQIGLTDNDLGVAVPEPGRYLLPSDTTARAASGAAAGAALGAPIGAFAGLALMAAAVPGLGVLGLGGLAVGLYGGAVWGTVLGGITGLAVKLRTDVDEDRWCEIPMGGTDILVVARADGRVNQVRQIMEQYGARCFLEQARRVNG